MLYCNNLYFHALATKIKSKSNVENKIKASVEIMSATSHQSSYQCVSSAKSKAMKKDKEGSR